MKFFGFSSLLLAGVLMVASGAFGTEPGVDKLLDLLAEKSLVTTEEAAGLRADLAIAGQEEKEAQKEFAVIGGKPIKFSGYTQVRYRQDESINDTFDIRRARLDFKSDVTERFDYRLQADFSGTSAKLLDATIGYKFNPAAKLLLGQLKVPFSQENLISSPKLETINRSQVVEALVARGKDVIGNQNGRDTGAQVGGSFWQKEDAYLVDYALGVFNGAGINAADGNERKDLAVRLVFKPISALSIGGSFYNGRYTKSTTEAAAVRNRTGFEFTYVAEPLSLKGEYIKGVDSSTSKDGWYLQAAYSFVPKTLQGVLKYDVYDSDTGKANTESGVSTLGVNYFFNKLVFLQVNYELKAESGTKVDNNALSAQFTLQF